MRSHHIAPHNCIANCADNRAIRTWSRAGRFLPWFQGKFRSIGTVGLWCLRSRLALHPCVPQKPQTSIKPSWTICFPICRRISFNSTSFVCLFVSLSLCHNEGLMKSVEYYTPPLSLPHCTNANPIFYSCLCKIRGWVSVSTCQKSAEGLGVKNFLTWGPLVI